MVAHWHLLPTPFPAFPKFIQEKIFDAAEVNQQQCLGESEQLLHNVDRNHLVLTRCKLVLQKRAR